MSYPGAKVVAIPIDGKGVGSAPSVEVGAEYTSIQFSASKSPPDPTLVLENVKLFADQAKKRDVTSQYFQSQEYWGGYNRICHFKSDLEVKSAVTLWYDVYYTDEGIEHDTDPTVKIDPRGG